MYSPCARPSRTRAAPAKNRIWSTIGGISSRDRLAGVLALDLDELLGVLLDHVGELEQRALTFTRGGPPPLLKRLCRRMARVVDIFAEEFGADAYTSPVDGLTISIIWPSDAGWISPPMMLWMTTFSDMGSPTPMSIMGGSVR
jgi:hypothetical protein